MKLRHALQEELGEDLESELIFVYPVNGASRHCVRCVTCVHQKNCPFCSLPVVSSYLVGELFC